jgi:hypothetical protein
MGEMDSKSFRLLIFSLIALGFVGFADTVGAQLPLIDNITVKAHDADNRPDNPYGIRLVTITVEGGLDVSDDYVLGSVLIARDDNGNGFIDPVEDVIKITQGYLWAGGHELRVTGGTHIVSKSGVDDMIETNLGGGFIFVFALPADIVKYQDVTLILTFGNEEGDLDPQIYDPILFSVPIGERRFNFAVQVPQLTEGEVDDRIYRNGDWIEVRLEYETPFGGPPLSAYEEIELLTIMPDFSNVDSRFALGNSEEAGVPLTVLPPVDNDPAGRYDLTSWDPSNTGPSDLDMYDLALDVDRALRDGRLIIDPNGGDYDVIYVISEQNLNSSGRKTLLVHAIDYPFVLDIFDAPSIFTNAGLDFPDDLNIQTWATCATEVCYDNERGDIFLASLPPNFDFAILDPFVNMPLVKFGDFNYDGVVAPDEWGYVFKEGDTIRLMIQIDPHDLTEEELDEVDPDDLSDTGNRNGTVSNIIVIGDISALLDPTKVNLITDANRNGIPDAAEVYTVEYAGRNGKDDDFDGGAGSYTEDDGDDSTLNGFNERYMYILKIDVTDKFRGASGYGPHTTPGLPIRFMIEDNSGNRSYFSTWSEELYDFDNWAWREAPIADWGRDIGLVDGVRNPMYLDLPGGDEVFVPDGVYPPYYSSLSYQPTPVHAKMPDWSPGYHILANWDMPFRVIIDAAYPNVSIIRDMRMKVEVQGQLPGEDIAKGAAVVPLNGPNNINNIPPTVLINGTGNLLTEGNFIYEITGNGEELVTLEAYFPSDDDMYFVKFQYSEDDVNFKPMKGNFTDYEKATEFIGGQLPRESLLNYDIAGNIMDTGVPGARYGMWHDAFNGDDDGDSDPDLFDDEVDSAHRLPLSDGKDNDADGLLDMADRDENNYNTEVYYRDRDDDEDGYMDEDEYIVPARLLNPAAPFHPINNPWIARWTFDPLRIARVLDLSPNKAYAIRALAYDMAGNAVEYAAGPIYVIFRVAGPGFEVEGDATVQIYKNGQLITGQAIQENRVYDLVAVTEGIVNVIAFQYSIDRRTWVIMPTASGEPNPDTIPPFRISWRPTLVQLAADLWWDWNEDGVKDPGEPPFQSGDVLYIRALALPFGQLGRYQVVNGLEIDPQTFAPYAPLVAPPATTPPSAAGVATIVSDTPTLVLDLQEGWNLVSICVDTGNTDLASILSQIGIEGAWDSVWAYDTGIGWKWHIYGVDESFNTLHTLEPKRGYWINMNIGDIPLVFEGTGLIDTTVLLYTGPNLVGYSSFGIQHPADALASIADDYTSVWTYKGGSWLKYAKNIPGFPSDLSEMEPGSGYLIYVESDCDWVIPE